MRSVFFFLVAGIVSTGCSAKVLPETQLAGVLQQFNKSANEFHDARRAAAKQWQQELNAIDEAAMTSRSQVETLIGTWRLADDKERLRIYEQLVANAKAAGAAGEAFDTLLAEHAKSVAEADTKYNARQEHLVAAVNALISLGTKKSVAEMLSSYYTFATSTMAEVKKLQAAATKASDGTKPSDSAKASDSTKPIDSAKPAAAPTSTPTST